VIQNSSCQVRFSPLPHYINHQAFPQSSLYDFHQQSSSDNRMSEISMQEQHYNNGPRAKRTKILIHGSMTEIELHETSDRSKANSAPLPNSPTSPFYIRLLTQPQNEASGAWHADIPRKCLFWYGFSRQSEHGNLSLGTRTHVSVSRVPCSREAAYVVIREGEARRRRKSACRRS
jgi:hypothetical protein